MAGAPVGREGGIAQGGAVQTQVIGREELGCGDLDSSTERSDYFYDLQFTTLECNSSDRMLCSASA